MREIVLKSKLHKAERAKQKSKMEDILESVDEQLEGIRTLLPPRSKPLKNEETDEYDLMVKELSFETRAHATDRLKTPEELALLEKERLESLEHDRRRRLFFSFLFLYLFIFFCFFFFFFCLFVFYFLLVCFYFRMAPDAEEGGRRMISADEIFDGFVVENESLPFLKDKTHPLGIQEENNSENNQENDENGNTFDDSPPSDEEHQQQQYLQNENELHGNLEQSPSHSQISKKRKRNKIESEERSDDEKLGSDDNNDDDDEELNDELHLNGKNNETQKKSTNTHKGKEREEEEEKSSEDDDVPIFINGSKSLIDENHVEQNEQDELTQKQQQQDKHKHQSSTSKLSKPTEVYFGATIEDNDHLKDVPFVLDVPTTSNQLAELLKGCFFSTYLCVFLFSLLLFFVVFLIFWLFLFLFVFFSSSFLFCSFVLVFFFFFFSVLTGFHFILMIVI
jgi:hypothetical protein